MLLKSVVTRLLIFPIRLESTLAFPLALGVEDRDGLSLAFPLGDDNLLDGLEPLLGSRESAAVEALLLSLSPLEVELPAMDALSGVPTTVMLSWSTWSLSSLELSALSRIRKLCSNTSCVRRPSVRTKVRVAIKIYHWKAIDLKIGPTRRKTIHNHGRIKASFPPVSK